MSELYETENQQVIQNLKSGILPGEHGWRAKTEKGGYGIVQIAARNDLLPDNFSDWGLMDVYGIPVAHIALERGTLPVGFSDWEIRDRIGRTLAHLWAQKEPLPPDFNLWTLRDRCGFNVAETACIHRNLPDGIADWQDLIMRAGTPKNVVPPILPFPYSLDSLCPAPDLKRLPTIRSVSSGTVARDDFAINLGNFLDAFYLYKETKIREYMLREFPYDTPENWHVPFLGATAAVLARRFDLSVPPWSFESRCYFPDDSPYVANSTREFPRPSHDTPPEFKERNIFVSGYILYRI
ncbi:MAG: hypothetical protein LBR80_15185 [Deltaproteobacteria bacterium]|jgi:hypothetical protein|nr:hypothetical protein [Deltaproteobacteria bacterium]